IRTDPDNPWAPHTAVAFYLDADDPRAAESLARDPVVAAGTAVLRAQYARDWDKAAAAALADSSFVFTASERWGVPAALRDYALRTGQYTRIVKMLSDRYSLPLDGDWKLDPFNFREGQLLAQLLLASGKRAEGVRRLDAVIAWIDANERMGP